MGKRRCDATRFMQRYLQGQAKHDSLNRQHGTPTPGSTHIRPERQTNQPDSLNKNIRELEDKAFIIANKTMKEALEGIPLDEIKIGQEVLRKIFTNTKD